MFLLYFYNKRFSDLSLMLLFFLWIIFLLFNSILSFMKIIVFEYSFYLLTGTCVISVGSREMFLLCLDMKTKSCVNVLVTRRQVLKK